MSKLKTFITDTKIFIKGVASLPDNMSTWTPDQITWAENWTVYLSSGGTRPPQKPPL